MQRTYGNFGMALKKQIFMVFKNDLKMPKEEKDTQRGNNRKLPKPRDEKYSG
jgi:hypothetical protein